MGLLDTIKGLLGNKDVNSLKDQAMDVADRNNDGKVDMEDFNELKDSADLNQDGTVNKDDLDSLKDRFPGK